MKKLFALMTALAALLLPSRSTAEEVGTSASACVIIDEASGRVLLQHNAETPLPMASTTKVMTALLALERGSLSDRVIELIPTVIEDVKGMIQKSDSDPTTLQ